MDECLYRGFIDVADVRSRLSGLATGNNGVGVDETESVDNNFSFDRLDGVNYYCDRTRIERFE